MSVELQAQRYVANRGHISGISILGYGPLVYQQSGYIEAVSHHRVELEAIW